MGEAAPSGVCTSPGDVSASVLVHTIARSEILPLPSILGNPPSPPPLLTDAPWCDMALWGGGVFVSEQLGPRGEGVYCVIQQERG
jgi:hypothetical protein